jgi:2-dehydro-3-deoxyphosphooctonate aldolase (KDO 8-P synthase)
MKIIAGPCQHESLEHSLKIATECKRVCDMYGITYFFKASYDKANRTSMHSKRGAGMNATLRAFKEIKASLGVKTLTDVHSSSQVSLIEHWNELEGSVVDVLQIPALLCRQTDLIRRACETNMIVNIKKGQFLAPWDVAGILSKTEGAKEVWITERGTSFGYNNLVVDFTGIKYMMENFDAEIVFDASHSSQKPSSLEGSSGGDRSNVSVLAKAAAAIGVKNLFVEVHDDPDRAPSDGSTMLHLKDFERLVNEIHYHTHSS